MISEAKDFCKRSIDKTYSGKRATMNETTLVILLGGLMGFFGGLFTIPINALLNYWLKRDELKFSDTLATLEKQRELLHEHKQEMDRRGKNIVIAQLSKRVESMEKRPKS